MQPSNRRPMTLDPLLFSCKRGLHNQNQNQNLNLDQNQDQNGSSNNINIRVVNHNNMNMNNNSQQQQQQHQQNTVSPIRVLASGGEQVRLSNSNTNQAPNSPLNHHNHQHQHHNHNKQHIINSQQQNHNIHIIKPNEMKLFLDLEKAITSRSRSRNTDLASPCYEDLLPSQIMPHLYVGNQDQVNEEILTKLNITYVLSLQTEKDFGRVKITFKANDNPNQTTNTSTTTTTTTTTNTTSSMQQTTNTTTATTTTPTNTSDMVMINNDCNDNSSELIVFPNGQNDTIKRESNGQSDQITGKFINCSDTGEQSLGKVIEEANNFIEEARRNKCNILVHCNAGISRSPAIAIAYVMKKKRLHFREAFQFVKRRRPQIEPNFSFCGQLMRYEQKIRRKWTHDSSTRSAVISPNQLSLVD